jgi:hypothetical protein
MNTGGIGISSRHRPLSRLIFMRSRLRQRGDTHRLRTVVFLFGFWSHHDVFSRA